jgi:DNA-binding CsgD family transcriptional regulator
MADSLNDATTQGNAWETALQFLPDLGLSKVVFFDLTKPREPLILSNAGFLWTDGYRETVKAGLDPFPLNCLSRIDPMLTGIGHLEANQYLDDEERDMIALGSETLNIRTGMSVTICPDSAGLGVGLNLMTNLSVAEFMEIRTENEADWRAWCQLTYAGLSHQDSPYGVVSITARERDCLAFIADGLRTGDVAHRLGISESTVEMHTRNARNRLGAKTRDQAVAIAIRAGLI